MNKDDSVEDVLAETTVGTPWNKKDKLIKKDIANLVKEIGISEDECAKLMVGLSNILKSHLPEKTPVAERARAVLDKAGAHKDLPLIHGVTFSDLANIARQLDKVTVQEREQLTSVIERRNDAAHFRAISYDDAYQLETVITSLLPKINSKH